MTENSNTFGLTDLNNMFTQDELTEILQVYDTKEGVIRSINTIIKDTSIEIIKLGMLKYVREYKATEK